MNAVILPEICHAWTVTTQVWFDGDEILWDRAGYMLSDLLVGSTDSTASATHRQATVFADVLPTLVSLGRVGTTGLVQRLPMPQGCEHLLPPFAHYADSVADIAGAGVVLVSESMEHAELAAQRGWLTVWLNRARGANLSEYLPDVEIHSLLDLPDVLQTMGEAREVASL